jgi:hypothetical protein
LRAIAPCHRNVLAIRGEAGEHVKDVTLRGLCFEASTTGREAAGFGGGKLDGAVRLGGACDGILLECCTVRNTGGQGIVVGDARHVVVRDSLVEDTGGPGMTVRGEECVVENCVVRRIGRIHDSSIALRLSGRAGAARHNSISHCPYTAINAGGEGTVVEGNRIADFMEQLNDGAAVYITFCRDVSIRGNLAVGASGRLAHAYYMDEQCEGCSVSGNVAIDTRWPAHNHMARACSVVNNVFVDAGPSKLTFMKCRAFRFERNVIRAGDGIELSYPAGGLATMGPNLYQPGRSGVRAVHLRGDGYGVLRKERLRRLEGSLVGDAGLRLSKDGRCSFRRESPAARLGIAPVDVSRAGPQRG